jgi:uncharacterized protein (TIGR01777 family)
MDKLKAKANFVEDWISMNIGIFGSTGFIGKNLERYLSRFHSVVCFTRNELYSGKALLALKLEGLDVIINLIGAPILDKRWTKQYKELILDSRIGAIVNIRKSLELCKSRPPVFISASAVGIYKPNFYCDEFDFVYHTDFLSSIVKKWEAEAMSLGDMVAKSIVLRFGIVLGKDGGALKKLIIVYKLGLGGALGDKQAAYPYISINDVVRGILFLIENKESNGIYNFVAPVKINNAEFSLALARALHTVALFSFPAWALRLFMGRRADVILAGQYVFPRKLTNLGFEFQDTDIAEFLKKEI